MKSVLTLLFLVIIAITSYGVFVKKDSDKREVVAHPNEELLGAKTNHVELDHKTKRVSTKKNQQVEIERNIVENDINSIQEEHLTEKFTDNIGEDLVDVSYEQINNDTFLSDEEKEMKIIDKVHYESVNETSSQSFTEEEILKIMEEDLENGLIQ